MTDINNPADPTPFFTALYNGDGLRVKKEDTRGGTLQQHDYSYGPQGLLWESNPNTVYTPGFGHRSNGISKFYQTDWLGSTRYVTDSSGNTTLQGLRFDGFGNRIAMFGSDPYHSTDVQYAGEWGYQTEWASLTDPGLGLQYLQQRYYDPGVGRFISPDPIGLAGGLNLYGYVDNNPVNWIDPPGTGPMRPLPGVNGAEYRTDMTEHRGPDMHIKWGKDQGETMVDNQGRVVITKHGKRMTVPVPTDKKKRGGRQGRHRQVQREARAASLYGRGPEWGGDRLPGARRCHHLRRDNHFAGIRPLAAGNVHSVLRWSEG